MHILWRAVVRNRRRLTVGSLLIGVHQICETSVPILIGLAVDRAVSTGSLSGLGLWVGALAGLFLVLSFAYRLGARQLMRAIADEGHALRLEITEKALTAEGLRTGEALTISTSDADNTSYLMDYIPRIFGALVATVVGAVGLFVISVPLGLLVLIGTPLVLAALQLAAPRVTRSAMARQEVAGRAASLATDLVTGLRPLRGIGAKDAADRRYREVSGESLRATLQAARTHGWFLAGSQTISTLLAGAIAVLAGWFALTGRISAGELVTVIGLAGFLGEPFTTLTVTPGWIAEARASADRIAGLMALPSVAYGRGEPPVRPVAGECLGVVTDSPSPLLGLLDDGSPGVLVAPHDADLFSGSIRYNLITTEISDEIIAATASDDVIAAHPDGLDHEIRERGSALSGGQRQRLALARALLARPSLLVLHDPTTAVDTVTEHAIAQGLRELRHGAGSQFSTLIVTTSPALLAITDRVVVLRDGEIVASGSHAELSAADADYRAAVLR